MDRDWLASELARGRSIEAIAREVGRDPSTVAYWANKHGLVSTHAARHTRRGGVERGELFALVEEGRSIREIAAAMDLSPTTIRHWLKKFGLRTQPSGYARRGGDKPVAIHRRCAVHGWTEFKPVGADRLFRCARCLVESVAERRRALKRILVREAGGCCSRCGYDRYAGALQFHHRNAAEKAFSLSNRGVVRSLAALRQEARKCVLLCANCHAEVEAGLFPTARGPTMDASALPG
jgi:transposase-like protein